MTHDLDFARPAKGLQSFRIVVSDTETLNGWHGHSCRDQYRDESEGIFWVAPMVDGAYLELGSRESRELRASCVWPPHEDVGRLREPRPETNPENLAGTTSIGVVFGPEGLTSAFHLEPIPDDEKDIRDPTVRKTHGPAYVAPLILRIAVDAPPLKEPLAGAVRNHQRIVDVQPSFQDVDPADPKDRLRVQFYTRAARVIRSLEPDQRSAVQRLVFGNEPEPTPLWFLILDSLGGRFQLRGFPGESPSWQWVRGLSLTEWETWVATLACSRAHIAYTEATEEDSVIPPPPFRDKLASESGLVEIANWLCRDDTPWVRELVGAVVDVGADSERSRMAGESASPRDRFLSAQRFLLPRSRILVDPPDYPLSGSEAYRQRWVERVRAGGWLDIVRSALWPEDTWPTAVLRAAPVPRDVGEWPIAGDAWHEYFFGALHESSFVTPRPIWRNNLAFKLGSTRLGSDFTLPSAGQRQDIAEFRMQ